LEFPLSICKNEEIYNISDDNHLDNMKNILKLSLLCKFHEFDNNDTIDGENINYCFPNGFEMIHNPYSEQKRKVFSIIFIIIYFHQNILKNI